MFFLFLMGGKRLFSLAFGDTEPSAPTCACARHPEGLWEHDGS